MNLYGVWYRRDGPRTTETGAFLSDNESWQRVAVRYVNMMRINLLG